MTDFVELHKEAANYLDGWARGKRIASAWPLTDALQRPEFGYVQRPLKVERVEDFRLTSLANLDRSKVDVLVVFSRAWSLQGRALDNKFVRSFLRRYWNHESQATAEQILAGLGFLRISRLTRGEQWIEIYLPEQ